MKSTGRLNRKSWRGWFHETVLLVGRPVSSSAHPQVDWLVSQQGPWGLYDSYMGDGGDVAYLYDHALVEIALTAAGEYGLAAELLARFASLQNSDGSWPTAYFSQT